MSHGTRELRALLAISGYVWAGRVGSYDGS